MDRDCFSGDCRMGLCARLAIGFEARTDGPDLEGGSTPSVGDFDNDGFQDVVILRHPWVQIIYRGRGDGSFKVEKTSGIEYPSRGAATGDLNGDGWPDLVATNFAMFQGNISAFVLQGEPKAFQLGADPLGPPVHGVIFPAIADMNGDQRLDLALVGDVGLRTYLQGPTGTLIEDAVVSTVGVTNTVYQGWVADLDSDGSVDAVLAGQVTVLVRSEKGVFGAPKRIFNEYVLDALPGDFDEDGKLDTIAFGYKRRTWLLRSSAGNGTFLPASPDVTPWQDIFSSGSVADFDRDGHLDVMEAIKNDDSKLELWFFPGDGRGHIGAAQVLTTNQRVYGLSALVQGDFNRDGKPDLVVDSQNYGLIFMLNTSR